MSGILYGNLRVDILAGVGDRVERITLRLPAPRLGLRQDLPEAEPAALLLGRADQLDQVRHAIRAQRPIEFTAPCGFGKSTLLRQVAADATSDGLAGSCVYLRVGDQDIDDVLQRLVDGLYSADEPVKPTPEQCAQLLGQVNALILLDDVLLDPGQVERLVRALPGCSLVLGSPRPVLGRHGRSQILAGLPDDAALELLARDLGRPLADRERPAAKRLVAAVQGQPLHLRQAAALVRHDGMSLATLARKARNDREMLDRLSVDALAEHERRALAVLALAAGALLPKELVAAMGDIAQIGACLGLLHRRGLADRHADRFGLPACKVAGYREMLLNDLQLGDALRELGGWLANQNPTGELARSAAGAALAILEYAAERGDWPAVVRLVRVVEPILTLAGRWEACRRALELGLQAAEWTGDRAAEAFFSHQQGTLALCRDQLDAAERLLERALELREQLGDHDGAAVTRHNLQIFRLPAGNGPNGLRSRLQGIRNRLRGIRNRLLIVGAVLAAGLVVGSYIAIGGGPPEPLFGATPAALSFGQQRVGTTSSPRDLTIRNMGTGQLRVAEVTVEGGDRGDFRVTANRCGAPIDPGQTCSVEVSFGPTAPGSRTASLVVRVDGVTSPLQAPLDGTGVRRPGDRRAPVLRARDLVVEATSKDGATAVYAVTAVDDRDGRVPVDCRPASGSVFPFGTTEVGCTASDSNGNTAHGRFAVTVRDSTPPTVSVPGDVTIEAAGPDGSIVEFAQPTASDRVDGPVAVECAPLSGGTFPLGITTVTCSAVDSHGNEGRASFDVVVRDTTAPKIGGHADIEKNAYNFEKSLPVTFDPPSAEDTVDPGVTVTCVPASGSDFLTGETTTVTCTAIDDSGNRSAPSSFKVTVHDKGVE